MSGKVQAHFGQAQLLRDMWLRISSAAAFETPRGCGDGHALWPWHQHGTGRKAHCITGDKANGTMMLLATTRMPT